VTGGRGLFLAALLLALLAPGARASALDDLVAEGRLRVESALEPEGPLVPGQRGLLRLTVSTDRWFAGGTRIELPEAPGLIVLQTSEFAANSSERRDGQSWVVQRWTLDVYATGEGRFDTGPITLRVHVNTEQGVVSGPVQAPPVSVVAAIPPGLTAETWLAAPAFSARQQFDPETTTLRPGDAITRTVTLEASDVLDKMLPDIAPGTFDGLASYPAPPQLSSSNNRGQTRARRVQAITYVAEAPGEYLLPGYDFAWWNTAEGRLESVRLEPLTLTVTGPAPDGDDTAAALPRWLPWAGAAVLAGALLGWAARRWLPWGAVAAGSLRAWRAARDAWRRWRAPALPPRLNPWD
jgi:hypothetical protein